jgi:hypothetical protein
VQIPAIGAAGAYWAGSPGARRTLERCAAPGAGRDHITDKNVNRIRIGGVQQRCSLLVLKHFHRAPER